jgi:hypothetical protein
VAEKVFCYGELTEGVEVSAGKTVRFFAFGEQLPAFSQGHDLTGKTLKCGRALNFVGI